MSMDEVMTALRVFQRELDHFTATMQSSVNALEREHQSVVHLWQDSFSKEYHKRWNDFDDHMAQYLKRDAPKYKSFLSSKVQQLGRYLGHG